MVHVQQGALRAFKQQVVAAQVGFVQLARDIGQHGADGFGLLHGLGVDGFKQQLAVFHVGRQRGAEGVLARIQQAGEDEVVEMQQLAQLGGKAAGVAQVLRAQGAAGHFVFVGGADAPARGADFFAAALLARGFAGHVQRGVQGQDERAGFAHAQALAHLHAGFFQLGNFFQQLGRREHDAVADVARHARAHDAAGDEVQRRALAANDQGVARVVPALKAHHALRAFGEPVHQLAFAFIAPLGADDNDVASACAFHEMRS